MTRTVWTAKVGPDGVLHLTLPADAAGQDVQVTVEPVAATRAVTPEEPPMPMTAADLLNSGLVGMWADRTDIGDSREYARQLREQAQNRRRGHDSAGQ